MATHDYNLANQDGASFRSDLNNALAAIVSNNSSSTAPATTFAHQIWVDTTANVIKQRNAANDAWVELWRIDGGFNAKTFNNNVTLNAQSDLRFADSDSSNWVAFQAPATVASDVTWTLPDADGTANQALTTDGSGVLSWADAGGVQDNITEGNTSAEVVDTGSDGHFKVVTEGTEALRVDANQRLLFGTSTARTNAPGGTEGFLLEGTSSTNSQNRFIQQVFGSSDAAGPYLGFGKTRSTSIGGNTVVQDDDELGGIYFQGADGSNFKQGASIISLVDGTPGTDDMPARLVFATTADGASSPTERFRIGSAGQLGIGGATYGTSGQVLTSQGSGSPPQWATPSAGLSAPSTNSLNGSGGVTKSVPSGTRRISIVFYGVSTASGSGRATVYLGNSGGLISSGYKSAGVYVNAGNDIFTRTDGWMIWNQDASISWSGTVTINLTDGTSLWAANWTGVYDTTSVYVGGGTVNISNVTQVGLYCAGIGQFDGGTVGFYFQ